MIVIHILGWFGLVLILLAYFLVSSKLFEPDAWVYQTLNIVGAVGLFINALVNQAWPNMVLVVLWALLSAFFLIKIIEKKKK
ncbi:MAG: hypothetical protein ABH817_01390 [archaeon]